MNINHEASDSDRKCYKIDWRLNERIERLHNFITGCMNNRKKLFGSYGFI